MKLLDEHDWPRLLRPGSRVFIGGSAAVPHALVASMLRHADRFMDLEIVHIHGLGPTPWIEPQYEQVIRTNSFFLTPALHDAVERGQADYTPCAMSEVPALFQSGRMPLDVALVQVTPPDGDGLCSLGVSVDVTRAAVKSARLVIAQVNPKMPRTGGESLIPVKEIDYFYKHTTALPEAEIAELDERQERIGRYAAQLIDDGATLQVGLGNTPEAVIRALRKHRHLGIHTGMFNDALMDLVRCGAVNNSRKSYKPGKIIASHVLGSRKLYRFADGHADLELHPSDWVNDPQRIARNDKMVSVNGAREIDLTGQVVRDSSGHRFYGGVGALQDFIRGAGRSKGGRPIIALTSLTDDGKDSRIVAGLQPGSGVCTGRGDVHHVVTEYGIASIYGRSIRERVARLVEIAHPDHREALLEGARTREWLPKFFTMPGGARDEVESGWVTFSCGRFRLRPLHPSDMKALQSFFYSHDEETVRLRYGYRRDRMTGESAYKLAAVDQGKDHAFGLFAETSGREELRAIGRYYLDPSGTAAEVAFVVHENTRRSGMAGFLLGELAQVAKKRGIVEFWASVMAENHGMSALFARAGGVSRGLGEEREFRLPIGRILRWRKGYLTHKNIRRDPR
ncbi:GNAT family N-acetyltransferase [Luteolibacter flavescens]|uniref:GNAT family N-acetyltransferase n=1 Tax=Luteolibacter flavescens TaxID=1859460 RepID=A0ABT3FTU3_9BACT|nr:GNAT family N-acetyltransferase [Luteolibacter flavescens]MCW1886739.1 GNAT family N-acetyltransferase [Luteolibacter flavescens]